jgi:1-acyl-sn-glycerol-3-phosphate acyltransferase
MPSLPDKTARSALDPLWRGLRTVRAAITVGFYLVIAPSGYVPFALFCLLWRGDQRGRARILHRISARGVRIMHWWLRTFRIIHFDWRRVDLGLPAGPCVVVANHPTQLDPTAMMAVLVNGCTIVKPSVYRRRLVRPLLEGAMHFEGPSLDPMSIDHVLHSAVDRLRCGMHLFVFPEGTRSPEGKLNEFGRIAFEIACRANVPIVSVALRCEPCYLSRETPLFRPPARLPRMFMERLAIDDPASCGGDSRVLRERIEGRYRQWVADGMPPIAAAIAPAAGGLRVRR